jgi:hypothetical protein
MEIKNYRETAQDEFEYKDGKRIQSLMMQTHHMFNTDYGVAFVWYEVVREVITYHKCTVRILTNSGRFQSTDPIGATFKLPLKFYQVADSLYLVEETIKLISKKLK